jgi:hypothetical protein
MSERYGAQLIEHKKNFTFTLKEGEIIDKKES